MRHQFQRENECLLASVCNACDIGLVEARKLLPTVMTWYEYLLSDWPAGYTNAVRVLSLVTGIDLSPLASQLVSGLPGLSTPDLTRKGIIIVRSKAEHTGHAVAFEHGQIVDSNFPELQLESIDDLMKHIKRYYPGDDWTITSVVYLDGEEK